MAISRRSVLKAGATLCALAAAPLKLQAQSRGTFEVPYEALRDPLYYMNRQQFEEQVGTTFKFASPNGFASLRLIGVKNLAGVNEWTGHECFSLHFKGSLKKDLPQDTYDVRQLNLGSFRLLLVPVGQVKRGRHFEALINRLV